MALFGLVAGFFALVFAEMQGSDQTRPATRAGYAGLLLVEMGLTLSMIGEAVAVLLEMIPI